MAVKAATCTSRPKRLKLLAQRLPVLAFLSSYCSGLMQPERDLIHHQAGSIVAANFVAAVLKRLTRNLCFRLKSSRTAERQKTKAESGAV